MPRLRLRASHTAVSAIKPERAASSQQQLGREIPDVAAMSNQISTASPRSRGVSKRTVRQRQKRLLEEGTLEKDEASSLPHGSESLFLEDESSEMATFDHDGPHSGITSSHTMLTQDAHVAQAAPKLCDGVHAQGGRRTDKQEKNRHKAETTPANDADIHDLDPDGLEFIEFSSGQASTDSLSEVSEAEEELSSINRAAALKDSDITAQDAWLLETLVNR